MWTLKINNVDSSRHSQEGDALKQKQIYIDSGSAEDDIVIVETDIFNPPQPEV